MTGGQPIRSVCLAIQTAADAQRLRALHGLPADLPDLEVAEYALQRQRARGQNGALPPYLLSLTHAALIRCEGASLRLDLLSATVAGGEGALLTRLAGLIPPEAAVFAWGAEMPAVVRCRVLQRALTAPTLVGPVAEAAWHDLQARVMGRGAAVSLDDYAQTLDVSGSAWMRALRSLSPEPGSLACGEAAIASLQVLLHYQLAAGQISPDACARMLTQDVQITA